MKIIVGLGNPGAEYAGTRHNVGFQVVDSLVALLPGSPWKLDHGVEYSCVGDSWILKPCEFMNTSGPTLRAFARYKHLPLIGDDLEHVLIVVHDDLDFPLGAVRQQLDRSAAGHNGIQSIIDAFHTQKFSRLRIGIGSNREANIPAENYVLLPFGPLERPVIDEAVVHATELLQQKLNT